jgi:transposase
LPKERLFLLQGFRAFLAWLEKRHRYAHVLRVTVEATGVYYEQLAHFLARETGYRISVVLPNMSKAYAKSLNLKSKTDKIDANMLGRMGLERDLQKWEPLSDTLITIKQLTRDRVSLIEEKVALKNKLHALDHSYKPNKDSIRRVRDRIKMVERQKKQVEKQIAQQVEKDAALKGRIEKVCGIKGIGLVTVATIVAETNGFALIDSRAQLTSFCGYDVVQCESGSSVKGKTRISKKGNRFIRRALHFPALVAVKHDARFRSLFDRVLLRTAIKMKAYVAVQRKLLLMVYSLFKNNVAYDPDFLQKNTIQNESRQDASPAYAG